MVTSMFPSHGLCSRHHVLNLYGRRRPMVRAVREIEKEKSRNMIINMHDYGVPVIFNSWPRWSRESAFQYLPISMVSIGHSHYGLFQANNMISTGLQNPCKFNNQLTQNKHEPAPTPPLDAIFRCMTYISINSALQYYVLCPQRKV